MKFESIGHLKDGFRSILQQILQSRHFVVIKKLKNFKLLADISFDSVFRKTALPRLLLFWCTCY